MFAVLVCEFQAETTFLLSSTVTTDTDLLLDLAPRLQAPPTAGIFFANSGRVETRKSVTKLVRSLPPAMHLVGSEVDTLVGTTSDGKLKVCDTSGLSITAGAFPEAQVGSFMIDVASLESEPDDINEYIQQQLEPQDVLRAGWKVMVIMSAGAGSNLLDDLLPHLQNAHPDAAIVGGIVTGRWLLHSHAHKVQFIRHGVVGLMFRGNVPLTALVAQQEDPSPQLAQAKAEQQRAGKSLLGGLLFTCTGRDCAADAAAFSDIYPNLPLAGMPSNGEIGPEAQCGSHSASATQVGRVALQGYTAVYGLFAVPVRSRCRPLPFSDVAAAYKESRNRPAAMAAAAAAATAASLDHTEEVCGSEESDDEHYWDYEGSESQEDEEGEAPSAQES